MRAATLGGSRGISLKTVPDPRVKSSTDTVVQVIATGICDTDLQLYEGYFGVCQGKRCGHEFVSVVADVGTEVTRLRAGMVVAPFMFPDGICPNCCCGLEAFCNSGNIFRVTADGGQADGLCVPFADTTLIEVPLDEHDERQPAVPALSDVTATGNHAVVSANAGRRTSYVVAVHGPVGLGTVLAAHRGDPSRIFFLTDRQDAVGRTFRCDRCGAATGRSRVGTYSGPDRRTGGRRCHRVYKYGCGIEGSYRSVPFRLRTELHRRIVFRHEANTALDPDAVRLQKINQYEQELMRACRAAERGLIDDVIDPGDTRRVLIEGLTMLQTKRRPLISRRHGKLTAMISSILANNNLTTGSGPAEVLKDVPHAVCWRRE